ncbi:RNA-binding protein 39 isoform X1 [Ischnura elegans]|uniref:RNA-binding protein 39 isoform X1 n=1 Tax=Ischnura elegans TaxID=197161 RepID=UPI001ED86C99|nr:RNA-binding protein 39 isoform X1 [Ischnura elegans]
MAEDLDVEALLEAPYRKGEEVSAKPRENGVSSHKSSGKSKHRSRSRSRERGDKSARKEDKGRDKERRARSRSRERRKEKDGERKRGGSREKDGKRKRSRERERSGKRSRSRSKERRHHRHASPHGPSRRERFGHHRKGSPSPIGRPDELSPEERDARTVFCMQLSARVRGRDLEEFFSAVGKVRDVRLITCNKTRRFKGIAYVEFKDPDAVPLAMGLSGQKLLGIPIIVQHTQAEKNRAGTSTVGGSSASAAAAAATKGVGAGGLGVAGSLSASVLGGLGGALGGTGVGVGGGGPMRLYVGSLHFNITEDMLRGIFEPFGKIDNIQLIMDPETGRSKGYGFITFHDAEDAKKALEQLNGFELAGRPMKVGHVTERSDSASGPSILDSDELDRTGIDLGATGRLQLMFKLAEGTGMQIPPAAANALNLNPVGGLPSQAATPPIATQCFMLANMFDPTTETNPNWDIEIRDDVIEECNKHGGVFHVYVDRASLQGNVYVKCPSIATAVAAVNSLHGRWFAGRVITAAYVPLINYHSLFPDAMTAMQLLLPSAARRPQ